MSGKQTNGWIVYAPAFKRTPERWVGTYSGSPFKVRKVAVNKMNDINRNRDRYNAPRATLYRVDMFYTPEDET